MATQTEVRAITDELAGWLAETPGGAVPAEVREAACLLILDHLGCSIGGSTLQPGKILLELFSEQGGAPQATVFATGEHTSLLNAVYLNSALSNLLDFDDTLVGHPGGTTISPALNAGEHLGRSGAEIIEAIAFAYEVMIRVQSAGKPTPERYRQVYGLGVWQALGAVIAAGRLLRLDRDQWRHALGLAAVNAPVPNMRKLGLELDERPFSWSKNNYGWAAQGGVLGALLASRGFLGNDNILDSERGFWRMAGSDCWEPDKVLDGLGDSWVLPNTGLKPYASCRWTHSAIDAVRLLREQHPDLAPERVAELQLETFYEVARNLSAPEPTDIIDAQFSVRHVMALELAGRSARKGMNEADLRDPLIADLRQRITLTEAPELSQRYFDEHRTPARLTILTTDGERLHVAVDVPWGDPSVPFSEADLLAKYRALSVPVIGEAASKQLEEGILNLNELPSVSDILPRRQS